MPDTHLHGGVQRVGGFRSLETRRNWTFESLKHRDCSESYSEEIANRKEIQN